VSFKMSLDVFKTFDMSKVAERVGKDVDAARHLRQSKTPVTLLGLDDGDDKTESCLYWSRVLDGFPQDVVEKQLRTWSFERVPKLLASSLRFGLVSAVFPERVVTEGQLASNSPCEDGRVSFDVASIRATCHCVVDGHGGTGTMQQVIEWFPVLLVKRLDFFARERELDDHDIAACLHGSIMEVEAMLMVASMENKRIERSGACFACAIVMDKKVIAANVGDCGVFLSSEKGGVIRLSKITYDHTPLRPDEAVRVKREMHSVDKCPLRPSFP
jgi:Protein phosphatase 2C